MGAVKVSPVTGERSGQPVVWFCLVVLPVVWLVPVVVLPVVFVVWLVCLVVLPVVFWLAVWFVVMLVRVWPVVVAVVAWAQERRNQG
jgi:hypothetical protein